MIENHQYKRNIAILALSAESHGQLLDKVRRYIKLLEESGDVSISDLCITNNGEADLQAPYRLAVCAKDVTDLQDQLVARLDDLEQETAAELPPADSNKIAFLFTGAGSQYIKMGYSLYATQPVFRAVVDECDANLQELLGISLLDVLYSNQDSAVNKIDQIVFTQIAIFVIEIALFELWRSWGIVPNVVMGHSLGEYAAACAAGVFSRKDGLTIVAERGRLMQELPGNVEMAAVSADKKTISNILGELLSGISIAAENTARNTVISGKVDLIEKAKVVLSGQGVDVQKLNVSRAGHSKEMEPMIPEFKRALESITFSLPKIELVSNVTGEVIGDEVTTPDYWCRHLRETVKFRDAMETLASKKINCFIEVGPKPMLLVMGRQCLKGGRALWVPSLSEDQDDLQVIGASLSNLYNRGVDIDWMRFDK